MTRDDGMRRIKRIKRMRRMRRMRRIADRASGRQTDGRVYCCPATMRGVFEKIRAPASMKDVAPEYPLVSQQ
jgi:hypothetical protein